jgi:endoribonuclease Dicer
VFDTVLSQIIFLIFRYDVFESQLSYACARARTRGRESHLLHMVEQGNDVHRRILSQITQMDDEMRKWTDTFCQRPESSVPPPTLRETTNPYQSDSEDDDNVFIKDPTTSGRIRLRDATAVIYRFAASFGSLRVERSGRPLFKYEGSAENGPSCVSCTITLPGTPIDAISGSHTFSISHARRAACYQACLELSRKGLLDYRLFPLPSSVIASGQRHHHVAGSAVGRVGDKKEFLPSGPELENKALGSRRYRLKQPDFWHEMVSAPVTSLCPTVVFTDYLDEASRPYAPMLILTRRPLPNLERFKLFFSGVPADVHFKPCAEFQLDEKRLHDIYMYTIRVCRAVSNKPLVCSLENMAYFFAPLDSAWKETEKRDWRLPDVADHIPWDLVSLGAQAWAISLRLDNLETLTQDIEDAVIQDRLVEFTRRYDAIRMRPDLTPLSKPADSPVRHRIFSFARIPLTIILPARSGLR